MTPRPKYQFGNAVEALKWIESGKAIKLIEFLENLQTSGPRGYQVRQSLASHREPIVRERIAASRILYGEKMIVIALAQDKDPSVRAALALNPVFIDDDYREVVAALAEDGNSEVRLNLQKNKSPFVKAYLQDAAEAYEIIRQQIFERPSRDDH